MKSRLAEFLVFTQAFDSSAMRRPHDTYAHENEYEEKCKKYPLDR